MKIHDLQSGNYWANLNDKQPNWGGMHGIIAGSV